MSTLNGIRAGFYNVKLNVLSQSSSTFISFSDNVEELLILGGIFSLPIFDFIN